MSIILYCASNMQHLAELASHLRRRLPLLSVVRCHSLVSLINCIRSGQGSERIGILLIESAREMADLLSIREDLLELRLILIMPVEKREMMPIGHRLYPRFIAHHEEGFEPVTDVVAKMMEQIASS